MKSLDFFLLLCSTVALLLARNQILINVEHAPEAAYSASEWQRCQQMNINMVVAQVAALVYNL